MFLGIGNMFLGKTKYVWERENMSGKTSIVLGKGKTTSEKRKKVSGKQFCFWGKENICRGKGQISLRKVNMFGGNETYF